MKKVFKEIRLHRGKPPQAFSCHLLHQERDYLVLRYVNPKSAKINDVHIKKGSTTIAHYWTYRNYILWKMKDPDGKLKGYLFHICKNTEISNNRVTYEDLELDIWVDHDGHAIVLDQDDVDDCYARGLIDSEEIDLINVQKEDILTNFKSIIESSWTEEKTA